jgi:hypothetical protein
VVANEYGILREVLGEPPHRAVAEAGRLMRIVRHRCLAGDRHMPIAREVIGRYLSNASNSG